MRQEGRKLIKGMLPRTVPLWASRDQFHWGPLEGNGEQAFRVPWRRVQTLVLTISHLTLTEGCVRGIAGVPFGARMNTAAGPGALRRGIRPAGKLWVSGDGEC